VIYYLVTARRAHAMQGFLATWGSALADRIQVVTYESIVAGRDLSAKDGTYIFTNINNVRQLPPDDRARVQALHDRLFEASGPSRVHNNPARVLTRYELLRELHARGVNDFNAYRLEDRPRPRRYPVFIRNDAGTENKTPQLLADADAFQAALHGLTWQQRGMVPNLLAVEFCDTADANGVYRKYSTFVIGSRLVPRHLLFSAGWMLKLPDLLQPALLAEEVAFLDEKENPFATQLLAAARVAGISYGRFDYAVSNGRPQIWELNTNSTLTGGTTNVVSARDIINVKFTARMTEAFRALDAGT
jgi:hypothetical protein